LTSEWRFIGPGGSVTVPVSGNLRTNNTELIRAAALHGRGVVIAADCLAEEDIGAGRLVQLFPKYHSGDIPLVALYPSREYLPLKVRSFIDFAVAHFADHPALLRSRQVA
jgi:DNA-binding transcriptional LysR family regulator